MTDVELPESLLGFFPEGQPKEITDAYLRTIGAIAKHLFENHERFPRSSKPNGVALAFMLLKENFVRWDAKGISLTNQVYEAVNLAERLLDPNPGPMQ